MKQTVENKPVSGGFYMNPLVGLYRFPRGENLSYYKDHFETYDEERKFECAKTGIHLPKTSNRIHIG